MLVLVLVVVVGPGEVGDDVGDHARRVVGRGGDGGAGEVVQHIGLKDIPPVLPGARTDGEQKPFRQVGATHLDAVQRETDGSEDEQDDAPYRPFDDPGFFVFRRRRRRRRLWRR